MFTTVSLGLTTMTELSTTLSQVTGLAASAGIPFETLSAAIAALTTTGMPTAQAINSIKAAIQNIIKPTGDAEEMAKSLGLGFDATALKTKGFENVLWDAYKATGGNTEKMAQLFGSVEALNAVLVLASDKTGNFKTDLEKMANAAGATQTAYAKVVDEFKNINQRLENSFKITVGEIGEKIMPEYGKIAGSLGDLMKGIKVGIDSGAFDPLFAELDRVGGGITKWIEDVGKAFPEALKDVDFRSLADAIREFGKAFSEAFSLDDVDPKKLADSMNLVVDSLGSLLDVTRGIGEVFAPFLNTIKEAIKAFNNLDSDTKVLVGNLLGLSMVFKAFGPLGLIMVGMGMDAEDTAKVMNLAFSSIGNGMNTLIVGVLALAYGFSNASLAVAKLRSEFACTAERDAAAEDLKRTSERVKIIGDLLEEAQTKLAVSSIKLMDAMTGSGEATKKATSHADDYANALGKIPKDTNTIFNVDDAAARKKAVDWAAEIHNIIPDQDLVTIKVLADGTSIETADGMITTKFPDGKIRIVSIGAETDDPSLTEAKSKLDKAIPDKKQVDIEAKLEIEKLKIDADKVGKMIEWKAKIDIAEVEATVKILEASFNSINTSVTSTGESLTSLFGTYATIVGSGGSTYDIMKEIQKESGRRDDALLLQKDLITAQIAQMKARTTAMENGQALIQIDGTGLAPHLEAFMFEVLSAIQVRAAAEGLQYLVGI
jgi:hypothetical protein